MKTYTVFVAVLLISVSIVESLKCLRVLSDINPTEHSDCPVGDGYCFALTLVAKTNGAKIDATITGCSSDLEGNGIPSNLISCTQAGKKELHNADGITATIDCCTSDSCNSLDGKGSDGGNGGNGNSNSATAPFVSYGFHLVFNFLKLIL